MKTVRAFTLVELLVVIAIIVLLVALVAPSLGRARDIARRATCGANVNNVGRGLFTYATESQRRLPGIEDDSEVMTNVGNDYTNSTAPANSGHSRAWYLLVRGEYVELGAFFCPADSDGVLQADIAWGSAYDFPAVADSYPLGYAMQVTHVRTSTSEGRRLTLGGRGEMAIMADANALLKWNWSGSYWRGVRSSLSFADNDSINSTNHDGDGQNVLFLNASVGWKDTPKCGVNNDNIYVPDNSMPADLTKAHPSATNKADSLLLP